MGKCDPEIYKNGKSVGIIAGGNATIIETVVKELSKQSKQPMDWHYVGGRANVLTTGDIEKAIFAFKLFQLKYLVYEKN